MHCLPAVTWDVVREALTLVLQALIEAEAAQQIGPGRYERSAAGSPTWTATPLSPRICHQTSRCYWLRAAAKAARAAAAWAGAHPGTLGLVVQPLPPGPLAVVCAWPGRGIPSARVEVDGAAIREAPMRR